VTTREALQALRKALGGWSQERLAQELGVRVGTVSRWERGVCPLNPRTLTKLRRLVADNPQPALAFIDEEIAAIMETEEQRLFGTSTRASRGRWVDIAERNWRLTKALKAIEWMPIFDAGPPVCVLCDQTQKRGHSPDCLIGMALTYGHDEEGSTRAESGGDAHQDARPESQPAGSGATQADA
jgi:transcriptional regulator with XRE-family HTH domain